MKTSLKSKILPLLLGVTLGLGVISGVTTGNKASEVKAGSKTLIIDGSKLTSTATTSVADYKYDDFTITMSNGAKYQTSSGDNRFTDKTILIGKSGTYVYNKDPIGSKITKFEIYANKGASAKVSIGVCFSTTEISAYSTGTNTYTATLSTLDHVYDCSSKIPDGAKYFWYQVTNANNSQVEFRITYEEAVTKYNVSFSMQGHGTAPSTQSIEAGGKVSEPTAPSVSGYIFGGWYEEAECINQWNFSTGTVSGTKVLYAKWTQKTALTLVAADVNMKLGDSDKSVAVTAGGSAVSGYTLTSGETSVISIVNNQLHVVGLGDATITITKAEDTNNTYTSGTFNVHVDYADITSFKLDYTESTLGKGGTATLPGVTILPANANQGFSWGDPIVSATSGEILYKFKNGILSIDSNNTGEGKITFVATADGDKSKSADVVYTIEAAQIAHITGVNASATGEIVSKQYVGVAFNPQGFSFAPSWSEGEHEEVVIGVNDISWNALVAGSNPTGTYSCADGDFTVTIEGVTVANDTLASIAFAEGCKMSKTSYWVGDSWDFSGLSIVGTMDSGLPAPAIASSDVTFSSNDAVATTTTSITVTASYQGLTTAAKTITGIEVKEPTTTSLTVTYTGDQPVLGNDFVFAGSITANMSNGTHQTVQLSDVTIGSVDKFTTNQQTITVTHKTTGATGTFNVTYKNASYTTTTEDTHSYSYDKVTSSLTDWRGKYLIVYETDKLAMDGSLETLDAVSNTKSVTISNNSITTDKDGKINENAIYFTVDYKGTSTSIYSLMSASGKYISGTTTSAKAANGVKQADTPDDYEITFNGTELQSKSSDQQMAMKYNKATDQKRFRFYKSGQEAVALYKFTDHVTPGQTISTGEKHAIRIGEVTCSKSPLIAGETISESDFKIQVQYDTGTALTSNLTPTSVSPATLVAGTHDYTITYTGSYNDTVTKVIQLTAKAPAVLDGISITKDAECDDVFTRNDTFTHNGIHVIAHYTDSTEYPDADVTANADITPPSDMNVAGTKIINVSYKENNVTKTTSYQITVNPIVSTYLTLFGKGIEGSNGVYTLNSEVSNTVNLTIDKDGDEEIDVTNQTSFLSYSKTTGVLTINSSTTTSESGKITFTAGSQTATLTVNVSAAESIELKSDKIITGYVGDSFSYDVKIELHNVASATWTIPTGDDFNIKTTSQDNTSFVGSISFTKEITEAKEIKFSALTGKGKTLSVVINVLAANDNIKTISASLKSGVTYTAGQGQTFSKDDLTVTSVRDSGAPGTLNSDEFTVSGNLPEGSFNRVASYDLTVTSTENTDATSTLTINVGMPKDQFGNDLNIVTSSTSYTPGTPTTSWSELTAASQLDADEKVYICNADKGYVSGYSGSDATVVDNLNSCIKFDVIIVDSNEGTFRLYDPTSKKEVSSNASNKFTISADSGNGAVFTVDEDGELVYVDSSKDERRLYANGNYLRCYKTSSSYDPFIVYISKTTPGQGTYNTTYSNNAMTATIYNFIAKANELYSNVCGTDENPSTVNLKTWAEIKESNEYKALLEDENSLNLLKSVVCGDGSYDERGLYSGSKDFESSQMVIDFIQKYDRVVSLYYEGNNSVDYLGRVESGLINVDKSFGKFNFTLFGENSLIGEATPSTWVITIIAVAGLAAVGGYFYTRKRKED